MKVTLTSSSYTKDGDASNITVHENIDRVDFQRKATWYAPESSFGTSHLARTLVIACDHYSAILIESDTAVGQD